MMCRGEVALVGQSTPIEVPDMNCQEISGGGDNYP